MPPHSSTKDEGAAFLDSFAASSQSVPRTEDDDLGILSKHVAYPRRPFKLRAWLRFRYLVIRRSFRRHPRQTLFRIFKFLFVVLLALFVLTPIVAPSYTKLPAHYVELESRCAVATKPGCANPFREKVFISISLYDKDGRLVGGKWGETILELINLIGPNNVFLSIYENDVSSEGTTALEEFGKKVPCKNELVIDTSVSMQAFPTVTMPDGSQRIKRLAYLSEMRNRALGSLDKFSTAAGVVEFDKILFLNDVAFRPVDAAHLLFNTDIARDGSTQYLAACALDYRNPFLFYDLYAQRDAHGYSNGLPFFPIFSHAGNETSRQDMLAQKDAVRVRSCWGGMVAMQARYVQNANASLPSRHWRDVGAHVVDPARPANATAPVRFRHEPEVFYDACECCLFMADAAAAARRAGARETAVVVNPYVRVAYDFGVLGWLPVVRRWERLFAVPHAVLSWLAGLPTHNPYRAVEEGEAFTEEVWDGGRWTLVDRAGRSGLFCGVREMQLLRQGERTGDVNWVNVRIPAGQALHFPA